MSLASIEASVGTEIHKVSALMPKVRAVAAEFVTDVNKIAPFVEAITGLFSAPAEEAEKVTVGSLNAISTAIKAAGTQAAGGITMSLPAEFVADFQAVESAVLGAVAAVKGS